MRDNQAFPESFGNRDHGLSDSAEIFHRIFEEAPDATLLVDTSAHIVKANAQTEKMFGYPRNELLGQPIELLIPERFAQRHVGYRDGYMRQPRTRTMGAGVELFGRRRDSTEFPVDIMLSSVESEHGALVLAVVRDITERKRMEQLAQAAREMYIREIHHRIKNNLQVISSLLFLQSLQSSDENIVAILKESQSRVTSIALIHERLYRSVETTHLDFAEYVRDLVIDLFRAYGVNNEKIRIDVHVNDVHFDVDTAIPCGLIINELVSNALKYAFPGDRGGTVQVHLRQVGALQTNPHYELRVVDDGVGLPAGFDWRAGNSLGLKLVVDLARQLEGDVEMESEDGASFRIRFRELHYKERS